MIDFRKFYDIITAFRCGSTVRDVFAVGFCKAKEKMIDESQNDRYHGDKEREIYRFY